jgi:hypothetical protein
VINSGTINGAADNSIIGNLKNDSTHQIYNSWIN